MIWKNIRKKRLSFEPAIFEESKELLENPCRGWYAIYTFDVSEKIDKEELKWSLRKGETLSLVLLDIGKFQDQRLSKDAVETIGQILEFFQEHHRDVILRPVYDCEGAGEQKEPKNFELVLEHLEQIGSILQENPYSLFLFQGLLVGNWGEMHGSAYLKEEQLRKMWEILHSRFGTDIFMSVRTPVQWRKIIGETFYENGQYKQLGVFDDGIFGSTTHLGTFGTMMREAAGWENGWNRKEELDFLHRIGQEVPFGGEVVAEETVGNSETGSGTKVESVLWELEKLHATYLNCVYDKHLLDQWKQMSCPQDGIWKSESLYDYIGVHLGYRFFVKSVEVERLHFGKTKVNIAICNQGFAPIYEQTELFLVIQSEEERKCYPISYEMRKLQGGCESVLSLTETLQSGEMFLKLTRKKDGRNIYFSNQRQKNTDSLYLGCLYERE